MKQRLFLTILFAAASSYSQSEGPYRSSQGGGSLVKPAQEKFSEDFLSKIQLPPGYSVNVFARGLEGPRMMVLDSDNTVYVSRPKRGDILTLKDTNNDGVSDEQKTFLSGYDKVHGMAVHLGKIYFVALKKVYVSDLKNAEKSKVRTLIEDLPDVGQHENRVLAIGPDQMLYIAIASNCNACVDPNKKMATIQRVKLDGSDMKTFAKGLRDTLGFDWHPETRELYGMDHGTDWRGDEFPKEELNHLVEGKDYGWPFCWNDQKVDENLIDTPEGITAKDYCQKTEAPLLTYDAHAAPMAFKFYNGSMFPKSQGAAFVAFHGSWNRSKPVGYSVGKVIFKNGQPSKIENFMSGFLQDKGRRQFGRPVGLLVLKDGSLLVSDDSAGVIYRVTYKEPAKEPTKKSGK